MTPKLGIAFVLTLCIFAAATGGCGKSSGTTPTPSPSPSGSPAPDTVYLQDVTSKTVRVYPGGSTLNGSAFPSRTLPTNDGSQPDVVFNAAVNVLWYPSAYPNSSFTGNANTPIEIWDAASTKNNTNADQMVPFMNGAGTAAYDPTDDLLFVADVTDATLQIYLTAHLMTNASTPAGSITINITDGTVVGTPRAQELFYDDANHRLYASDDGAVVAVFDNFGPTALSVAMSGGHINLPSSRQIIGLNSPDGLAYNVASDVLYIGEISRKQVNVVHHASTLNGPAGHGQTITGFSTGPAGMAYDSVRDLLFVYDPFTVDVVPNPEAASGNIANIPNRRQFFDASVSLSGFGIAVDTTH